MHITNDEQRHIMLTAPMGSLLLSKSWPTVLVQLITVIYNMADTYFVAKINNSASAAVGVVFSLMAIIQALGFGIGMGANSLISRCLGARQEKQAGIYGSSAIAVGAVMGLLISVVGLIFTRELMALIGASPTALPYAIDYGKYILIAAPVMCVSFVFNNILRAEGQSLFAMISMVSGGLLNLILDPLLIFNFNMGISGAAVATMISQAVSAAIAACFFFTGKSIIRLKPSFVSLKPSVYLLMFKIGMPTIFRQGLSSLSTAVLNRQTLMYGDAAVAAISIANKIYMLVRNIVIGVGQGYQPIAGYCYGAGNKKRVRDVFKLATVAGSGICLLLSVIIFIFSEPIMSWFRNDAAIIKTGSDALRILCVALPFMAYSTYVNQTYQCLGFSAGATLLASCRQGIFFIPLALILPCIWGLTGIELLQPVSDTLTFLISVPFCLRLFKRRLNDT